MPTTLENRKTKQPFNIMDTFLYLLAGSAFTVVCVSFLLWLRF